jgi:hypothetical protein
MGSSRFRAPLISIKECGTAEGRAMGVPGGKLSVDQAGKRFSRRMLTTTVPEYHQPYRNIGTPGQRDLACADYS